MSTEKAKTTTTVKTVTTPKKVANKQRTKPVIRPNSAGQVQIKIPECSMHYASALANPYICPAGACIPCEMFPLPSRKEKFIGKGQFVLGTTGQGFVLANPAVVNDIASVTFTTVTSVGTNATALSAFTNVSNSVIAAIPFTAAQMTAGTLQARVVSYGLRAQYVGKMMDTNGEAYSYEEPDHQNVFGLTPATIMNFQQTSRRKVASVDTDYCGEVFYSGPVQPSDVEFTASNRPINNTAANWVSAILIDGVAGDKYNWEIVIHVEYIGNNATGRTMSHSEPVLAANAIEAAKTQSESAPLNSFSTRGVIGSFMDSVRDMIPTVVQGGQVLSKVIQGDMAGAAVGLMNLASNPRANPYIRDTAVRDSGAPQLIKGGRQQDEFHGATMGTRGVLKALGWV